jgi:Holliday junction resolvasome RuvABC endonuclease subunit
VFGELYQPQHGDSAAIKTKPEAFADELSRLEYIEQQALTWIDNWQPSLVAMEGYSFSKNGMAALGELGGVLKMAIYRRAIPLLIVPPFTLKKFTTGSGSAPKETMMMEVLSKWGFRSKDNNEADAYALARFGQAFAGGPATWTKAFAELALGVELKVRAK